MNHKYKIILIIILVLSISIVYLQIRSIEDIDPISEDISVEDIYEEEIVLFTQEDDTCTTEDEYYEGIILRGQGLGASLREIEALDNNHVLDIISALDNNINFRLLQPNDEFMVKLCKEHDIVMEFIYKTSPILHHVVRRESIDEPLVYEEIIFPTEKKYRIIEGTLQTTLNQALLDLDVPNGIRNSANNVLESTVSFRTHARVGDEFKLFIEDDYFDGQRVGGTLLYASYRGSRAGFHEAFFFRGDDTRSAYNSHYTRDGKILASSAFRLPLDRIYVTSGYGYRIHPITRRRTFHYGIDYRGSTGTPVYAIADGVVKASTYSGGAGNMVVITHANGYESHYYHLHRRLVRVGQRIRGRQQIGTVGSTGRSTGPHLHLGLKHNGRWVNPSNMRMIATAKLEGNKFKQFQEQIKEIELMIERHDDSRRHRFHIVDLLNNNDGTSEPHAVFASILSIFKSSLFL